MHKIKGRIRVVKAFNKKEKNSCINKTRKAALKTETASKYSIENKKKTTKKKKKKKKRIQM